MNKFLLFLILILNVECFAQSVSVAPTRLYFDIKMGGMKTKKVKVTNDSQIKQSFSISFSSFESKGNKGKTQLIKENDNDIHSATKYLSANPSFFELNPGETKEVEVILQLPNDPSANNAKWSALIVKLAKEKMTTPDSVKQNMGFGIIPTMQFLVHIFQTPPEITSNISLKKAEIISFKEAETNKSDTAKSMIITAQNIGEVILDCVSYIEITNLQTGENQRLKPTPFTLLPNNTREIYIKIPGNLKKGKYSLLGVLDYRGKEVQAAEYDLEIK